MDKHIEEFMSEMLQIASHIKLYLYKAMICIILLYIHKINANWE